MNRHIIGLAVLAAITAVLWLLDYWCKSESRELARQAAERGRK